MEFENMVEWESVLRDAGERVQDVRDRLVESRTGNERLGEGAGGDVTMRVDKEAEDEIIDAIKQKGRDIRIVAEEHGESGANSNARWTVVVDPIDGSSNFEKEIPFYCTSIAVLEGNTLESASHALVRNLVNGDTYYSEAGSLSTKNGVEIRTSAVRELKEAVVGVDISKTSLSIVRSVSELISSVRRQVHFGANALEACFMAEGRIDGFVDVRGRMRVMDLAAAYLIGRQAGAAFSDGVGRALSPKISVNERFSVIAAANPQLHGKILAKLTPPAGR
jgi:myo-inositol-1(or 4)-monophosphatase